MQRKTLKVPAAEYIEIEKYMSAKMDARFLAFRHPDGTLEDLEEYKRQWNLEKEFKKNFLQSKGIPLDSFVEVVKSRDKSTFTFTWWE